MNTLSENKDNTASPRTHIIGVLSDTHGVMPPALPHLFEGVELIIHAGDIDRPEVLNALETLAPVKAVKGNMDQGAWCKALAAFAIISVAGRHIGVLHDLQRLDLDPGAAGLQVIISGHTHQIAVVRRNDILYLNPGSAAYPRHGGSPSAARLIIKNNHVEAQILHLPT